MHPVIFGQRDAEVRAIKDNAISINGISSRYTLRKSKIPINYSKGVRGREEQMYLERTCSRYVVKLNGECVRNIRVIFQKYHFHVKKCRRVKNFASKREI